MPSEDEYSKGGVFSFHRSDPKRCRTSRVRLSRRAFLGRTAECPQPSQRRSRSACWRMIMAGRLKGKCGLLIAADQGIGKATVLAFSNEGAVVRATEINGQALHELSASRPEIHFRLLDVRDSQSIDAIAAEIDVIDILFNCAGPVRSQNDSGLSRD